MVRGVTQFRCCWYNGRNSKRLRFEMFSCMMFLHKTTKLNLASFHLFPKSQIQQSHFDSICASNRRSSKGQLVLLPIFRQFTSLNWVGSMAREDEGHFRFSHQELNVCLLSSTSQVEMTIVNRALSPGMIKKKQNFTVDICFQFLGACTSVCSLPPPHLPAETCRGYWCLARPCRGEFLQNT